MAEGETFVIVGANLAGGRAAEALRKEGFDGRLVLVGEEPDRPYERPPLSKEFLQGKMPKEKVFLRDESFYGENDIDLRLGARATHVDTDARAVELEGGERIQFDKLLIATGGRPRTLDIPGADLDKVYYLRTIRDSETIAQELQEGRRAVVVGAGFIGAEVAASARVQGLEVTLLEIAPVPLEHAVGREIGGIYAKMHRDEGVDLRLEEGIERIEGDGRSERVVTSKGDTIDCDFVVIGVGILPNVEIAQGSAIEVGRNGIIVNEFCETSVPGVYAAGDVAEFYSPVLDQRLRVEHWSNAQDQGRAAALNMLGRPEPYTAVPWFWSDQYKVNMQYIGHADEWDDIVMRGHPDERKFTAFYLKDGKLLAALAFNRFKDIRASRALIEAGISPDAAKLRDEDVDLKALVQQ